MALDPEILFLDEPSAGLDPVTSHRLDDLILDLRRTLGMSFVIVTHELASIFRVADRVVYLDADKHTMTAIGPPKQLLEESGDPELVAFLSGGEGRPSGRRRRERAQQRHGGGRLRPGGASPSASPSPSCSAAAPLFKDAKRYVIFFEDSLEGLAVGAPVKYRGVQIGTVVDIQALFEMERDSVDIPVVIELERCRAAAWRTGRKTLDTLVEQGLRARLDLASLITGQLFVELSMFPGTPNRRSPTRPTTTRSHRCPRCNPACSRR